MIKIIIPGKPKRWERVRLKGKMHFDSKEQQENKNAYAWYARKAYSGAPLEVPLMVIITAYFKPSQSLLKTHAIEIEREVLPYTKTPDADNIAKLVGDSLNGVIWKDDSCIASISTTKLYSNNPRTEIVITELSIPTVPIGAISH